MPTEPIRRHYMDVEWDWSDEGKRRLRAWQRGQTGYPLIDAGMTYALSRIVLAEL